MARRLPALLAAALAAALTLAAAPPPARACLWDYDTLKEESLRDRDVVRVLEGDLGKHSQAFYEAKATYTQALIATGKARKERYDDLAVALAKTGKLDEALAVLADKDARFPGEYTTLANRGTFLAMKGDVAGALAELGRAVTLNPDAHFGREKVQIQLLEWMQAIRKDPSLVGKRTFLGGPLDRDQHIEIRGKRGKGAAARALDEQVKAMIGLVRFGDADRNPHLWLALGHALSARGDNQLAMFAYRRAELVGHPHAAGQGGMRAGILRDLKGDQPTLRPDDESARANWARAIARVDPILARGATAMARAQAVEDRKLAARRFKQAFGY